MHLTHNFRSEPQVVELVNRVCSPLMAQRAEELAVESPGSAVEYTELKAARSSTVAAGAEWLANDGKGKSELVESEARLIASRIRDLVGSAIVQDPDREHLRSCEYRDISILGRTREALAGVEAFLREYGIPFYNTATSGMAGRQEVLDLVTALRLVENPRDDLRAFAYLRSPFVGLRDEVLARIRLDPNTPRTSYLRQAEVYVERVEDGSLEAFPAPESSSVHVVEMAALRAGLSAIRDANLLVDRADHAELLEFILDRTGYRLHLLLRDGAAESLANLERFQALLADYRHLPLGGFLRLWDRWGEQDLGVPQAPLFSLADDVVTLSTIHTAKGMEWPVVFLARTREGPGSGGKLSNSFWSDPDLGPVFLPARSERGDRGARVFERALLEEHAEEARLLYVAVTRARDRLVISGPTTDRSGFAEWLSPALDGAIEAHEEAARAEAERPANGPPPGRTGKGDVGAGSGSDDATGTGRQIDVFGFDHDTEDANGQFSLFGTGSPPTDGARPTNGTPGSGSAEPVGQRPVVLHRVPGPIQENLAEVPVGLDWLEGLATCEPPQIVRPVAAAAYRFTTSATELRLRERDAGEWELRYRHGVVPAWQFAPDAEDGPADRLPATLRGTLIHGVLERIEEETELARILNEAIAGLDSPESETLLEPGTAYRNALEEEITAVVRGPEWAWYVEGPHWRELPFLHLAGPRQWLIGAFDLYRPPRAGGTGRDSIPWLIDFKTHEIEAEEAERVAYEYDVQVGVYREAVTSILRRQTVGSAADVQRTVGVALHFTRPNVAVKR
jgi:hypothetical protein